MGRMRRLAAPRASDGRTVLVDPVLPPHTAGMPQDFSIIVNGQSRMVASGLSVAGLLAELGLDSRKVAVERNEEIVPRSSYATADLGAGDAVEIVHFIGGG